MKSLSKLLIIALLIVSSAFRLDAAYSGNYNVGTGGSGGMISLFAAFTLINIDPAGLTGNVTLTIVSNITESATQMPQLNQWAGSNYTITIKPSADAPPEGWTIQGNFNDGLVNFNNCSNVLVDGGTGKKLTFKNNNSSTASSVFRLKSNGTTGCNNITITNCKIYGGSATTLGCYGVYAFDNTAITNTPAPTPTSGYGNNNLTITNNEFYKSRHGILAMGPISTPLTGLNISNNTFGSITPSEFIGAKAIWVESVNAPSIIGNTIKNMKANLTNIVDGVVGIHINGYTNNGIISRNKINGLSSNVANTGVYGINIMNGGTNMTISNNFISDIISANNSTTSTQYNPFGIRIEGGNNHKIFNNTVYMSGAQAGAGTSGSLTSAFMITQVVPALSICTGLDVRNNIFSNSITGLTGTKSYSMYVPSNAAFTACNYNDYYVSGANGTLAFVVSDVTSLAALKVATGKDANSVNTSVTFLNPASADLHLDGTSLSNMNLLCPVILPAVDVDIDNFARKTATSTQIGADEAIPNMGIAVPLAANPYSTAYCSGSTAQITLGFTGAINGYPDGISRTNPSLIYEWYHDNTLISGANTNSYIIAPLTAQDAGNYYGTVRVLDYFVQSNTIALNITQPTAIATQPKSNYLVCDTYPFSLTIPVIGTVTGYQWEKLNSLTNTWEKIAGQITNTLSIAAIAQSDISSYRLKVNGFNNNCNPDSIYSNIFNLLFASPMVIGSPDITCNFNPANGVCKDDMIKITANVSGTVQSYQWQVDNDNDGIFTDITGANAKDYIIDAVSNTDIGIYRCVLLSYCNNLSYTTNVVVINKVWDTHVSFTTNPKPFIICEGEDVLLSVNAVGIVHNYQWQKDGQDISLKDNSTANSPILKILNASFHASGVYTCKVQADDCEGTNTPRVSEPALVYVNRATNIVYPPQNKVLGIGAKAVFEVFAHITYPASVQWYKGTRLLQNNDWVEGAQSSLMTITNITEDDMGTDYWVVVTGLCGADTATNFGILTPDVQFIDQPEDVIVCASDIATFTAVAENSSSSEELKYQWYFNDAPLADNARISGSKTTTLKIENVTEADAGQYKLKATLESIIYTITSDAAALAVNIPPAITTQPVATIDVEETKEFTMTVEVSSLLPATYTWYKIDVTNVSVGNDATYTKAAATTDDAGTYFCEVSNDCGTVFSDTVTVTVTKYGQVSVNEPFAGDFTLLNNEPNPVLDNASIKFIAAASKQVKLTISDVYGREIATLFNEMVQPGEYTVNFNANQYNLTSGVYYYTLSAGSFNQTKSMIIVK